MPSETGAEENGEKELVRPVSLKAKCANCAGAVGIVSCVVPMVVSAIGIVAVGASQMSGMSSGGAQAPTSATSNASIAVFSQVIRFLSGFWGEVILAVSFGLMAFGMWHGRKKRSMILALVAALLLFIGMYVYFSIGLELAGSVILIFAYTSVYNRRFANLAKLG